VASTTEPGILTASADPDVARRAWPRWLALGVGMLAVAAVGLFWTAEGARVLLGATGLFLLGRGVVVLRESLSGLGVGALVAGLAAAVVATVSATASGWVLLVAVPVLLLGTAGAVLARGGARRRGLALLVWGLLLQAFGALGYFFASTLPAFYAAATLFGFVYAGIMPLYAVLARENFPLRMMGTIIGGTSMAGSLGMATGPVLGGWLFDTTGNYGSLYLSCFAMGIGACLIAMTFRPFPKLAPTAAGAVAA